MTPPARTVRQRQEALEVANAVRIARARAKDAIHADPSWHALELAILGHGDRLDLKGHEAPAGYLDSFRAVEALLVAPGLGPVRVHAMLSAVRASTSKTIAGLSDRQRGELVLELRRVRRQRDDHAIARAARGPRRTRRNHR